MDNCPSILFCNGIERHQLTWDLKVFVDKEKYIQVFKNVISDSFKFIVLNIPPEVYINYVVNVEKKFRRLFNNLSDNNKISKDELLKICPVGSRPGILYGNPKVHKPVVDNIPKFRPIISAINIPRYNLTKFFMPILELLTHSKFSVKDSFSFAKEIINYDSSFFMTNLDVESLFTNILVKETINNWIFTMKSLTTENSTNLKQQPVNLLLFLTFFTINKQTEQL